MEQALNQTIVTVAATQQVPANQPAAGAEQPAFDTTLVSAMDVLSAECAQWEAGAYATATEGLYKLLARCLELYQTNFLQGTTAQRSAFRKELIQRLTAAGIRITKSSLTMTMFIRYVFKSDRRRAQGYSYVLRAAVEQGISAAEFADFVRQGGGVEEIRRKMVLSEQAQLRRTQRDEAKQDVEAELEDGAKNPLTEIDAPEGIEIGSYCLVLGVGTPDRRIGLVKVLGKTPQALLERIKLLLANEKLEAIDQQAQHNAELAAMTAPAQRLAA